MPKQNTGTTAVEQALAQEGLGRNKRWISAALLALLLITALLLYPSKEQNRTSYTTSQVMQADLVIDVTATGTLEPRNQVDVGSEISGTMAEVVVDFNERVSRNQPLARLNTDEQQARVLQAQALQEVAEARVLQAKATVLETDLKLKRCETLQQKGLCPPQDRDIAIAAHARADADASSARAQVSQAKATLDVEQTRLAKSVIRSPIDGIVLKRQIEPGQTVAASLQAPVLFTLAENLAQMELRVAVDEADIGKVREGQHATFTVDAYNDQIFPAQLIQVRLAPISEGGVVSYETILSLNNEALLLRPGMTATAHITVQHLDNVLQVPNAALRFIPPAPEAKQERGFMDQLLPRWGNRSRAPRDRGHGQQPKVWVLENGQPKAIEVKTGPSDGRTTQIFSDALSVGMEIITDAAHSQ